jgi:flagellar biogenesis protein FliO
VSTRVDVEEIQTTKGEKLLAVVLAGFLLIGGIWAYVKIDDAVRTSTKADYSYAGTPAEQTATKRLTVAENRAARAARADGRAQQNLVLRREAYRTALEAHRPEAARLGQVYDQGQERLARAERALMDARREATAARPATDVAQKHIAQVQTGRENRHELLAFVFRLAFVLANIVFGYWLLARLRRRMSRYFPVGMAFVGHSTVLAFVMAGDYLTDYFDPIDLGPLVLSLVGIVATLIAFVVLQRYLAKRLPSRRVRKSDCPFCGYPVRGNTHCEGCGRDVIAPCAQCDAPRRVGTLHCGTCGAA